MTALPVEWVLVVYYGPAAHQATYGRIGGLGYTKDFIQLSKRAEFVEQVAHVLSVPASETGTVPLTFRWPQGTAPGEFVFRSADRPHLKWGTNQAPPPWRMIESPTELTPQTIPGDPNHLSTDDAEKEYAKIAGRAGGQPYLLAIKLKDEPRTLHLRAYLANPNEHFEWASLNLAPAEIQGLAAETSQARTLAWSLFKSGGVYAVDAVGELVSRLAASSADQMSVIDSVEADTGRSLIEYLRNPGDGLFFDPTRNHDAWLRAAALPMTVAKSIDELLQVLEARFPTVPHGDAAAERLEADPSEIAAFQNQIAEQSFAVPDSIATIKTRGSAQRAFANAVKSNYGYRCAITGVTTKDFLIASHIVPWSHDQAIRLDPSNGICLSPLVDRAFEKGYLTIEDDLTIRVEDGRIGEDQELLNQLMPYHGKSLSVPAKQPPVTQYLQRRRALFLPET
jgi:hypothetical protein